MAIEDLSTYTEVDPQSDLTVTSSRCAIDTMGSYYDVYLRADKGVGHFGDFEHLVTAEFTSNNGTTWPLNVFWALTANSTTVSHDDMSSADDGLLIKQVYNGSIVETVLVERVANNYDIWTGASLATPYYMTIERSGTTMTCKIYSDSGRTSLLDTLSIVCGTDLYRYIFATMGHGTLSGGGGRRYSGYVEGLDLQEGSGSVVAVEGTLAAASVLSGNVCVARAIEGIVNAVCAITSAPVEIAMNMDGTVSIVANVSGGLQAARSLAGLLSVSSSISGALGLLDTKISQNHGKVVMEVRSSKVVKDSQVNWIDHGGRQDPKIVH